MRNKKGFTLIELLAVIIILGILMIIAIPAVTEYISSSRKNAYITTASRYIDGVRNKINAAEIPVYDKETTYYIPGNCVSMEKGGSSPYGDWKEYYVVVTYDGTGYDYYWTSRDETNTGIYLTYQDLLDVDRIENNVTSISTNIGVGDREKILLLKDSCSINDAEDKLATSNIPEKGTSDGSETENPGNISMATDESCFEFDSSTGTITGYKCDTSNEFNYDTYQMLDVDKCVSYLSNMWGPEDVARLYCTDDPNFEFSLKEDILSGVVPLENIKEMINNKIIYLEKYSIKNVVIPETINGITVTRIDDYVFQNKSLYTIEIPKTVTYIGEDALSGNNLLYNIVNKTGRSFDWENILYYGYDTDNSFITGDFKAYNWYNVLDSFIKITSSPINKIDFNKMFSLGNYVQASHNVIPRSVTLNDSMGYNIYYNVSFETDEWFDFLTGNTVEAIDYRPVIIKILKNNNVIFIGILVPDIPAV